MKADVTKRIENIPVSSAFESYCFDVLSKYEAGRKSSLIHHLECKFSHMAVSSLADHNYSGANQSVNVDTIDMLKKSIKNILENKINYLNHPNQQISKH